MRFSGKIGYAVQTETKPGVWEDVITEHDKLGDVRQRTEVLGSDNSVLPEYRTTTSISVPSAGILEENYKNIRYVVWRGERWTIASVVHEFPRLVLYIGEVYNGPHPA